uniref:ATXR3 C-terminal domain-containing protein n=1 Tax=Setaria italica TaxID=4555 RepID=A0A0Q3V417_SETIT
MRDELRTLSCTYKCRHDAAADLIHMYAYTKCFFRVREYSTVKSPPVHISPLDLGPKYADKLGPGFQEYCKTYPEDYCLAQLIYWYSQNSEPESRLTRARKGCLSLPDVSSFYVKSAKPGQERVYGNRTVRFMLSRMEKQAQRPWPKDRIWVFKSDPRFFGSPMMDAVLSNSPLDKEMVHWLKMRPNVFLG